MSGNGVVIRDMLLQRGEGADEQGANVSQRAAGAGSHVSGAPVVTGAPVQVPRNFADEVRCPDTHPAARVRRRGAVKQPGVPELLWRCVHA